MNDTFTETTSRGLFGRLRDSVFGTLLGIVLVLACVCLLFWNEGNLIREKAAFREMKAVVKTVPADEIAPVAEGGLVHSVGELTSAEALGDGSYLKEGPYLVLERSVEMYQWKEDEDSETKKKLGGGEEKVTTYRYEKGWHKGRIDSGRFKKPDGHRNPELPVDGRTFRVDAAAFGAYDGTEIVKALGAGETLPLDPELVTESDPEILEGKLYLRKGQGESGDQIGDVRIGYSVLRPGTVSVVARHFPGGKLGEYTPSNGKSKLLAYPGTLSAEAILERAEDESRTLAWVLRIAGLLLLWLGLFLILNPIVVLLDVIPILGSIGSFGVALFTGVLAAVIGGTAILVSLVFHNVWLMAAALVGMTVLVWRWLRGKAKTA